MCHIWLVDIWVSGKMIMELISKCRRIHSKLKFSGRADYFYQSYKESNCPVLCPCHHTCPTLAQKPNVNFLVSHLSTSPCQDTSWQLLGSIVTNCPCDELLFSSLRTKPESKNIYILPIDACYKRRKYELFKFNFFMWIQSLFIDGNMYKEASNGIFTGIPYTWQILG
jgi:hypothetical protein